MSSPEELPGIQWWHFLRSRFEMSLITAKWYFANFEKADNYRALRGLLKGRGFGGASGFFHFRKAWGKACEPDVSSQFTDVSSQVAATCVVSVSRAGLGCPSSGWCTWSTALLCLLFGQQCSSWSQARPGSPCRAEYLQQWPREGLKVFSVLRKNPFRKRLGSATPT